jgi:hypothetical protein
VTRAIRFNVEEEQRPRVKRVLLNKIVGYSPEMGVMVYEDPRDGCRYGVYLRTGAKKRLDLFDVRVWTVGPDGRQREVVTEVCQFVDPPEPALSHAPECECIDCRKRQKALEFVDDFGQPGD